MTENEFNEMHHAMARLRAGLGLVGAADRQARELIGRPARPRPAAQHDLPPARPTLNPRPIKEPVMTFTDRDLRDQVRTATDASDGTYDVDAIVADIVERHGAVPVDDLDSDEFWGIVLQHVKA
jgi:hypothetical protein